MDGIISVLKPPGMTSHDVVQFIRRTLKIKKVGHTGTLDPGVPGVLPICVGKATRVAEYITNEKKSYRGIIKLGLKSDSQDSFGEIISEKDASFFSEEEIINCFNQFSGALEQIPPMVSAVKVKGKKLYELARKGIEVERKPREVVIHSLKIVKFTGIGEPHPEIMFDVTCSKGTYIRTLCHDIGEQLGCGALMNYLIRTASGPFGLVNTITLDEIEEMAAESEVNKIIRPIDAVLADLPEIIVRESAVKSVCSGGKLYPQGIELLPENIENNQKVRLKDNSGNLLAIAETFKEINDHSERWVFKPIKVFC